MLSYKTCSDKELVDLLKSDDQAAFTEIYERYKAILYIFTYKRIGRREETRDLLHELFMTIWEKRATLNIAGALLPYLYTAVKNRIMDMVAREQVASRYLDQFQDYIDAGATPADDLVRHNQLLALIEIEIAALPEKMRQVFELSRHTNLNRKEIAEQLNISEQTVKSHMHHALKILKNRLGPLFALMFTIL